MIFNPDCLSLARRRKGPLLTPNPTMAMARAHTTVHSGEPFRASDLVRDSLLRKYLLEAEAKANLGAYLIPNMAGAVKHSPTCSGFVDPVSNSPLFDGQSRPGGPRPSAGSTGEAPRAELALQKATRTQNHGGRPSLPPPALHAQQLWWCSRPRRLAATQESRRKRRLGFIPSGHGGFSHRQTKIRPQRAQVHRGLL